MRAEIDSSRFDYYYRRFKWAVKQRPEKIKDALDEAASIVFRKAKINITGRILKVRTGFLARSLAQEPAKKVGNLYVARVGNKMSPVNYGAAHEFGYTVPAMTIYPKRASVLRWMGRDGQVRFARYVNRPAYSVQAKPWLWPAFTDSAPQITRLLEEVGVRMMD